MAGGRRMRVRFALLQRHIAAIISIVLAITGLTFISAPAAQAVALNDNSSVFQITFTGLISLPANQTLVSPYGIQAAWTLNGTQPTDADFIDMAPQSTSFYKVFVPTSGTHSGVTSRVPSSIGTSDVVMLTLRDNPNDALTASLAGYIGVQTNTGAKTLATLGDHSGANINAKELISFGQFASFKYLEDAFARTPSTFLMSAKLPTTVTDLSYSYGSTIINMSTGNGAGISGWDVSNVTNFSYMFSKNQGFNEDLSSWRLNSATSLAHMFDLATTFNKPIDSWGIAQVTDLSYMFNSASAFNQSIGSWKTGNVTNMAYMFYSAGAFNKALTSQIDGSWDTSKVTNMNYMFGFAGAFNQNLSSWVTSSVTNFAFMFYNATGFNNGGAAGTNSNPLTWNTSAATNMTSMFSSATLFNQSLNSWDTSNVLTMDSMFASCSAFNSTITSWNTSKVTTMSAMFTSALAFNQAIGNWNVSSVKDFGSMFQSSTAFNQPLNSWDTSSAVWMGSMFKGATIFNQDLNSWNVGNVSKTDSMFMNATAFNGNISAWNTGKVTSMASMFNGASHFNSDISAWNTMNVNTMASMFYSATVFNANISLWDTSWVTDMSNMFNQATTFNQPIGSWNTRFVTSMSLMFFGATAFNQPIGTWDTARVTAMYQMFNNAVAFNQPLSGWNVSRVTSFSAMFMGASAFNQSLNSWKPVSSTNISGFLTNATAFNQPLYSFQLGTPASTASTNVNTKLVLGSSMSQDNVNATIAAWADQIPNGLIHVDLATNKKWFTDCRSYAAYSRLSTNIVKTGGGTNPAIPTGCVTSTLSWTPSLTNSTPTISNGVYRFMPDSMPTGGASDYRFTSRSRECQVNPLTGEVSYIDAAINCVIRAWDNDPNGSMNYTDVTFTLTKYSAPGAPGSFVATLTGSTVTFTWAAPSSTGSSAITNYLVRGSGGTPVMCMVSGTANTCSFSSLTAGTTYSAVSIAAINDSGTGTTSSTNFTYDLAPTAPSITAISPGTGLGLSVDFVPATPRGTAVTGYDYSTNNGVTWLSATSTSATNVTLSTQSTSVAFVGGTTYSVLLRGKTTYVAGDQSSAFSGTPLDRQIGAPTITGYSAAASNLSVTFTAPALTGSAISNYQYSTDGGTTWRNRATGTTASPMTITTASSDGSTIVDNTNYSVMLRAVTGAGSGVASTATAMKSNRPPTAPASPAATLLGTSATVSWSNSTIGLGITYLVTSTPGSLTCSVDQPSTSCTVNGLSYGTSYTFTVKATNTAGYSTSVATASVLPEITPDAPTITSVTGGSQQLIVNFTAGANNGSAITKYQYTTDGGTSWRDAVGMSSPLTLTTISGAANTALVNGTSYNVKIRAWNTRAGVASNQIAQLAGDFPGTPSGVSANTTGTSATVSWTASTGTVTSYLVTSNPGSLTCSVTAPATSCTVAGLTYGTSYTFTVVGVNSMGNSPSSAASSAVIPDVAPGAPTLSSIIPGDGQLTLAFSAGTNTGSSIVRYQYSTDGGATWKDTDTVRTISPLVITTESSTSNSLTNLTSYTVKLRAVNSISGAASASVTAMPMALPGSPTSVVASLTGTIANISWTVPTGSTPIASYLVSSNVGGFTCTATYPTSTCTVTGLALTISYTFTVTATNAAGDSAPSAASNSVTPEFAPGAPAITAITPGVGQLSVAFTGGTNSGSTLTKYQYSTDAGSTWNNFSTNSVSSPQIITGLTSGTAYDVQIRAYNSIPGNASATVTATAGTVPGAPTAVSAVASSGSATVSWTAPASNGGVAISSYTATSSVGNKTCTVSAASTSCVVSGLTNGLSYTFTVTAANSIGSSVSSAASAAVVPESAPGAPTITTLTPSGQQISVAFTAGTNAGSVITKYQYSLDGGSSWNDPVVGVIASPLIVTGLTNGTVYNVQIHAVNTIPGVSSGASSATPATVPGAPTAAAAVTGNANATVSWTAPSSNGGANISTYTVTSSPGNQTCTATAPATSCVVSSLTNGVAYTFTVKANNSLGASVSSAATSSVTPDVAPGAPIAVRVVPGDRQLSIEFRTGTNSGSAITKYQYTTDNVNWKDLPSMTSPFIMTKESNDVDVVNGQTYTVYLRAVNTLPGARSQGLSNYADAPISAPTITSITRGDAQLSIAFTPGTTLSGSSLTSYKYSTDGGATWAFKMTTTSPFTITQTSTGTSLVNGTTYNVKIAGFNTILGMPSNAVSATPKADQAALNWNMQTSSVANHSTLTLVTSGGSGTGQVVFSAGPNCSVVNNILTAGDAGGTCTVTATKSADTTYASKDISSDLVVTITKTDQATTPFFTNASTIVYGQALTLASSGGSGTGALSYSVQNAGTTGCAVNSSTGALTVTATGTCVVNVQRAGSTNFNASLVGTQSISVTSAPQSVSFTSTIPTTPIAGDTYAVTAQATTGLPISFSIQSGNCSISSTTVTFSASGNCVIKASRGATSQYAAATDVYQTISVGQRNQVISFTNTSRAISQKTFGDASFLVEATSSESAAVLTYSIHTSTTNTACSVTSAGLVRVLAVGTCVIEANSSSSSAFAAASPVLLTIPVVSDVATAPFITSVSAGNQAITVSFTEPSYDGGTAVSGYQVAAIPQSGSTPTIFESGCNPTATNGIVTCTVRGLANGVDYKVQVAGINAAGVGVYSETSNSLTVATNPSAVQNLSVVQDNAQLIISWADPDSLGGGTFQEYRLFVKRSTDASYDQNNYFVVANNNTHSLTLSTVVPSGASLVNGVGYDIKVITVTSANSAELTANTAVVNQFPRTVPDAPRFSSAFVMGANIVLTWETPESDGGAPISSYSAQIESSPCTFAAVTDTVCTVPLPASSYSVDYAVMALNVAGQSMPATGTLHIAIPPAVTPPTQTENQISGGTSPFTQLAPQAISEPIVTVVPDLVPTENDSEVTPPAAQGKKSSEKPQPTIWQVMGLWLLFLLIIALILYIIVRRSIRRNEI